MSDYRIDGPLDSETTRFGLNASAADDAAAMSEMRETAGATGRTQRALDKAEGLAARKLGALKARRLRQQADEAIVRGQGLYDTGRAYLDDQLAVAPYRTVGAAAFLGLLAGVMLTPRKKKTVYVRSK